MEEEVGSEEENTYQSQFEKYYDAHDREAHLYSDEEPEDGTNVQRTLAFGSDQDVSSLLTQYDQRNGPNVASTARVAVPQLERVGALADEFDEAEGLSEDEGLEDYKKGGYHPIFVGEVLIGRYVILQKLGWGHFSTVWLARDTRYQTYVAIKVQKSATHYLEAAFDEVEILQKAVKHALDPSWIEELKTFYNGKQRQFGRDDCHIVQLLNAFIYQGPYGRHFCMVFEILGVNLLKVIKRYDYKGIPLAICRRMARQILLGLHYLHSHCGIIDTDLKPENVLICLDKAELKEIHDRGQLNQQKRIQERANKIRQHVRAFNDIPEGSDPEPREQERLAHELQQMQVERPATTKTGRRNQKKKRRQQKQLEADVGACTAKAEELVRAGLSENFRVKIADLGNGCWTHFHFQPEIQTRQYRSPETILGVNYNPTADLWSFACMLFEMLIGDFLFDPKKNPSFRTSEDHLALMMELLNRFPREFSTVGSNSKHYLTQQGHLKKIGSLNFLGLRDVLVKFHNVRESEAAALTDFLLPMLRVDPRSRATAAEMLRHPWLDMTTTEFRASSDEIQARPETFDRTLISKAQFHRVVDEEDFYADTGSVSSDDVEEEEPLVKNYYEREAKFFDRNFRNVYIGYADGIDLNALDNTANWQFDQRIHC